MLSKLAINLINVYQRHIRLGIPSFCRFWPSCSEYAKQAIEKYGFLKGIIKGINRLMHCHPFSKKSGYDPLV